jgi:mono/diheme cytochrome c family protein
MVSAMTARCLRLLSAAALLAAPATHGAEPPTVEQARYLWAQSPHGRMLERILPPSIEPQQLPEPQSAGAQLTARYCIQCHYLPNPQMHTAARWQPIIERMVWRMRGEGNMGALMQDMMAGVQAPTAAEAAVLAAYLEKHAQREIDPQHPALRTTAGQIYSIACSQCHALPDPQRHTAREWLAVVKRMQEHMAWANTVVGVSELRTNPVLDTAEIIRLLQRYARKASGG